VVVLIQGRMSDTSADQEEETTLSDIFFPVGELPCRSCGTKKDATELKKCGTCGMARYCNNECQKLDWAIHKKQCKKLAVVRLLDAITRNDATTVRKLAGMERVLNGRNTFPFHHAETALHLCAATGNAEMMKILLEQDNCDVEILDSDEETPLYFAASIEGRAPVVKLLLDAGADPDTYSEFGWSAIQKAVSTGDYDNVKALLEAGANVYAPGGVPMAQLMHNQTIGANIELRNGETEEEALPRYRKIHELVRKYM
jgi:ankyrin repeat protein